MKISDMIAGLTKTDMVLFKKVKKIIDEWDPLDLWCTGCPYDEYDHEVWSVFAILSEGGGMKELTEYFHHLSEGNIDARRRSAFLIIAEEKSIALDDLTAKETDER